MCGIAGFVGTVGGETVDRRIATAMADAIMHRGPDDTGVWGGGEAGACLAHRRLSIVDLSPAGHQPMTSRCGRYVVVFNGEIYNHIEMRRRLDAEAALPWRGHCDTETLLEAIARWGCCAALQRTVGMFAFALWDQATRTLQLARDRFGEKPLYWGRIGGCFAFASELKAFRALPGWQPEIDRQSVAELMRTGYVPAPRSIFTSIRKLGPGEVLTIAAHAAEPAIEAYWAANDAAEHGRIHPFEGHRDEAAGRFETLLATSIKGQMLSDVPLGAFLSGGIDSSAVVAMMQEASARPVRTFTIGFNEASYDEAAHARAVARHLGTDHTEHYVSGGEARDVVPALPSIYCEPFADASQIPTYLISRLARGSVTVALTGDAGDEVFSGYRRYALDGATLQRLRRVPLPLRRAGARLAGAIPLGLADRIAGTGTGRNIHKAAAVLPSADAGDAYRRLISRWVHPSDIVIGAGEEAPSPPLPGFQDNVRAMMFRDLTGYLPDDVLVKVDRAAMAASLETRAPFLDHRLVEFSLTVPLSILRAGGRSKFPLRQLLYRRVPQALIDRPKAGFAVPIDVWLRGPLRDWAGALLDPARLRNEGYLRAPPITKAWQEHQSGRRDHQQKLWNVLMFQAWLEAQPAAPARSR